MKKSIPFLKLLNILKPVLVVILTIVLATVFINYRPFHAIISQRIVFNMIQNSTNSNFPESIAAVQNAISLNQDNCAAYGLLGTVYASHAFAASSDKPDLELLKKEIIVSEEGINHCPTSLETLFMEYALARDYSILGNHEQSIFYLQKLVEANPVNADPAILEMGDIFFHLGEEYKSLEKNPEALKAYIESAAYQASQGQQGDAVKAINNYLETDPSLAAQLFPGGPLGIGKYVSAARISDGTILLIGRAKENPDIVLYAVLNSENNWHTQRVLMINKGKVGALALDSQGVAHVVYSSGGSTVVYTNTKDGLDKSLVVDITKTKTPIAGSLGLPVGIDGPQIAMSSDGTASIVYAYNNAQLGYFTIRDGKSSLPILLANDAVFPDMNVSSDGLVYIVYSNTQVFPSPLTQVWFIEKREGNWSTPIQISEGTSWSGAVTLVSQADGTINVVYVSGSSPDDTKLMYTNRDIHGKWSHPKVIGEGRFRPWIPTYPGISFGGRTSPSIQLINNDTLAVVWRIPGQLTEVAGIARKNGVWGQVQILGQIAGNVHLDSPSIVAANSPENNKILILWPEGETPVAHEWYP